MWHVWQCARRPPEVKAHSHSARLLVNDEIWTQGRIFRIHTGCTSTNQKLENFSEFGFLRFQYVSNQPISPEAWVVMNEASAVIDGATYAISSTLNQNVIVHDVTEWRKSPVYCCCGWHQFTITCIMDSLRLVASDAILSVFYSHQTASWSTAAVATCRYWSSISGANCSQGWFVIITWQLRLRPSRVKQNSLYKQSIICIIIG